MVEQIITSHSILVKVFLAFLIAGLFIPKMTAKKPLAFKKASFIYTMVFQAIATMVAFTGIVAMITGKIALSAGIVMMIIIWGLLMFIEIKKYKLIKVANIGNPENHAVLKKGFLKIGLIQILLVAIMVVLMILKVKGIVAL